MPRPAPRPQPPCRRVLPALGLVAAVSLLHAVLLGLLPHSAGAPARHTAGPAPPTLQVRQLVLAPGAPVLEEMAESNASPVPMPVPTPVPKRVPTLRAPEPPTAAQPPAAPFDPAQAEASNIDTETDASTDTSTDGLAAASGEAAASALLAGPPLPTYATRLPPPATLQYAVQRSGANPGPTREGLQAQLIWRPEAAAYTLSLGMGAVGSASVGALDLHGIAPERHVETRRSREVRAANFQRQVGPDGEGGGRITFSGPRVEYPLLPGVQDRLSWMLQLAGVLAADPALGQPGREVRLQVVGVRGEAALWVFRVMALQTLALPAGEVVSAVHLQREAERPYDTAVDVWLDPARHHLPVRLRLQNRADGPVTAFDLLRLTF